MHGLAACGVLLFYLFIFFATGVGAGGDEG